MTRTHIVAEKHIDRNEPDHEAGCTGHNCAGLVYDADKTLCKTCRKRRADVTATPEEDYHRMNTIQDRADDLQAEHPGLTSKEAFAYVAVDKEGASVSEVGGWREVPGSLVAVDVVTARRKLNGGDDR